MGLTEKGDKRLEWIKRVIDKTRPQRTIHDRSRDETTGLPTSVGRPINEE